MLRPDRAALALGICSVLAITTAAAPAGAQGESGGLTSTLGWVRLPGAESCPGSQELARAVEARLGRRVFVSASRADLAIEGRAERWEEGAGFRGVVRIADADGRLRGERVIEQRGEDCRRLLAPLALAIAVTVDPETAPDPISAPDPVPDPVPAPAPNPDSDPAPAPDPVPDPAPDPVAVPDAAPDPVPVPDPAPVPAPTPADRWRLEVTLAPTLALGLLPFVAPGGSLAIFVTPPGFVPLYVLGAAYPWARAELDGGGWIDHLAIYGGLGICPLAGALDLERDGVALLGCAGLDAGAQVASGHSTGIEPIERERVLVQLDVALRVQVRIAGPLFFHAGAALLVPFRHERWTHRVAGVALAYHHPEPIAGVLDVGLGWDVEL